VLEHAANRRSHADKNPMVNIEDFRRIEISGDYSVLFFVNKELI